MPKAEERSATTRDKSAHRIRPFSTPSDQVHSLLLPSESLRGQWRRHAVFLVKRWLIILLYTGLSAVFVIQASLRGEESWIQVRQQYVAAILLLIIIGAGVLMTWTALHWRSSRVVLTNKRLILLDGVLSRRVSMLPLMRVVDLRYVTTPTGRLLDFGTFEVESADRGSGLRRIKDLPNPSQIYMTIVEEMYDPDLQAEQIGDAVSAAIREVIEGPTPVNYNGWASVEIRSGDGELSPSSDRHLYLEPNTPWEVLVTIAPYKRTAVAEPLVVENGVDSERATFTVEIDSDSRTFRRPPRAVEVESGHSGSASFLFVAAADELDVAPWLWVRIAQDRRTIQSIELLIDRRAD